MTATLIEKGSWGEKVIWEFYTSQQLPPAELCTAVFCVAMTSDDKIVLTRVKRGWEILGGHIEDGEAIIDTLVREAQEEGGFTPTNYHLLGYKKMTSTEPVPHQDPTKMYPHPHGYIVYFWATSDQPIVSPTGEEVFEAESVSFNEAMRRVDDTTLSVIKLGYNEYILNK